MTDPQQNGNEQDIKLHCNNCRGNTFHRLLKKEEDHGSEEWGPDELFQWVTTHEMFGCLGCKSVLMRRTYADSESEGQEVRYFPPRSSRHKPNWYHKLPVESQMLLSEIYNSLDADNRALPLMGARTLLDMLMVDKVGDVGTFGQKLKRLEDGGFISQKNREILEIALDAGSAASHRGYSPGLQIVSSVMDIVENLLQAMYVLDEVAAELKKAIPPRPKLTPVTKS
jgi:hypothetical protein